MMILKGQVTIVTRAGQGIGRRFAARKGSGISLPGMMVAMVGLCFCAPGADTLASSDKPAKRSKSAGNWWIEEKGLQENAYLKKGFLDVTLYDGWEGHAVDPKGVKDSTKALQQAVNDARDHELAAFFPSGTYRISDTLNCMKKVQWNEKQHQWTMWDTHLANVLVGSTRGTRPVLKLVDHAEGFNDPEHLKPAVILWQQRGGNRANGWKVTSTPSITDAPVDRSPPPTTCDIMHILAESDNGETMNTQLRGIDIYVGAGNPGAVGLASIGAQGFSLEDCKVTAYGAYAGFYNLPGSGAGAANIEVEGGRYGIVLPKPPASTSPTAVGVTLRNQTDGALQVLSEWTPTTLAGFRIIKESGPVVTMRHGAWLGGGAVCLVDGSIELTKAGGGGRAIDNGIGETLYLRNVYVSGATELVKSSERAPVVCPKGLTQVREYAFANPKTSATLLDTGSNSEEVVAVKSAEAVPADLISRNIWGRLPSFEDATAKCVTDPDVGAKGDGKADDTAALQSAIDKYEKVFLPNGNYAVGKTLVMHKNTKLFGATKGHVSIQTLRTWLPTVETPIILTDDAADGTAYLGDIEIGFNVGGPLENDVFNCLTWRVGRGSMIKSVGGIQMNGWAKPRKTTGAHRLFVITGNGGGRWYFWPQDSTFNANTGEKFRLMAIVGTHEPLSFYNYNPEHSQNSPQVEITGASNVRILGIKVESRRQDVFHIVNCNNVLIVGFGGHAKIRDGGSVFVVRNSTNVEVAVAGCGEPNERGSVMTEIGTEVKPTSVSQKFLLALFKRGEVNDQVWAPIYDR